MRINESVYPALENRPSEGHDNEVLQKWVEDTYGGTSCDLADNNDDEPLLRGNKDTNLPNGTSGAAAEGQ